MKKQTAHHQLVIIKKKLILNKKESVLEMEDLIN